MKHMKKAEKHIGWSIVIITMKMSPNIPSNNKYFVAFNSTFILGTIMVRLRYLLSVRLLWKLPVTISIKNTKQVK